MVVVSVGSSPHERGTLGEVGRVALGARFIPARAGNTMVSRCPPTPRSVHPRTSGEHESGGCGLGAGSGSSPHERGTRGGGGGGGGAARFIPARAGNTPSELCSRRPRPVHPRTSGEHLQPMLRKLIWAGSSPHERGTPAIAMLLISGLRFIPARAGNTCAVWRAVRLSVVHPRTSGEHCEKKVFNDFNDGSSPHERGTLFLEELDMAGILRCQTAHRPN